MWAVVFPGQGSQSPGMGKELFESDERARSVFSRVSEATNRNLAQLCFETDEDTLRQTQNAQLALFTCGLAAYACIQDRLPAEHVMAGHSVGEFAAVTAAGACSIETGAKLVQRRGEIMASAGATRPGTMAAILGLDRSMLEDCCNTASHDGKVVVIANDNAPGQLVISGDVAAVEEACELAKIAGAKRALTLNVSGAFHSPLMEESAQEFAKDLVASEWLEQQRIVVANVTAEPVEHGNQWPVLFEAQLRSPVRWTESVQRLKALGISHSIECGVGAVLSGLIKRIEPEISLFRVSDVATLEDTHAAINSFEVKV